MQTIEFCLDEALDLGKMELDLLVEGNIEEAEALANDRGRLLDMAWQGRGRVSQEVFLDKMEKLQAVHSMVSAEARRLHKLLKEDLIRTRKKGQGFSGYRSGMSATQEARFINKTG
ncbi:hypothetical protein SAMN05660653_01874 [Desulfonatronum thiosulfatophilum]|uniref:Flagellar protein FliT n=1 Tax=Desulfonatronum thiosulfatophilum TaxID=617002 RepID=A0A1G6D2R8_9BACT|nr:hypothetical protein [Desulfonatronum thiosulfatophilum]SDB39482.1 hypothetical protein SAMN05660653_01874 [Desulfonatronum thiosulfatophilum]